MVKPYIRTGRVIRAAFTLDGIIYQLERVRCGKPRCRCCPHGPYWYAYWTAKGKLRSVYVGKKLPEHVLKCLPLDPSALEESSDDET